uniref:Uncharacterized protein n=1 Tax=Rhizophora mucronata TaxID=61149 RepID=A0A2P2NDI7_RHIMU
MRTRNLRLVMLHNSSIASKKSHSFAIS